MVHFGSNLTIFGQETKQNTTLILRLSCGPDGLDLRFAQAGFEPRR